MIWNPAASPTPPDQRVFDRGARFRALASMTGVMQSSADNNTERQITRVRCNQAFWDDASEEGPVSEAYPEHSSNECLSQPFSGAGGVSVASLLSNVLIESARKSAPVADYWKLIVPLERARFPDSVALISSEPDCISVQFRSCHEPVVSMLLSVLSKVGSLSHHGLGSPVQCDVSWVATVSELYQ